LLQGRKRSRIKEVLIQDLDECFIVEFVWSIFLQRCFIEILQDKAIDKFHLFLSQYHWNMDDMTSSTLHLDDVWKSLSNSMCWTSRKPNKTDLSKFVVSLPLSYVIEKCYRYMPLCCWLNVLGNKITKRKLFLFHFKYFFPPMAMSTKLWTNFYAKDIFLM